MFFTPKYLHSDAIQDGESSLFPSSLVGEVGNNWGSLAQFWGRSFVLIYATAYAFKGWLGFDSVWDFVKFEGNWVAGNSYRWEGVWQWLSGILSAQVW